MKFVGISSLIFAAAATSTEFEEQVLETKLRGTPGTKRGKEWLAAHRSYVDKSLDWSADLKKLADSFTAESAKNNCLPPSQAQLVPSLRAMCPTGNKVCFWQWATPWEAGPGLSALPSPDEIFQRPNMPKHQGFQQVGCSDCLIAASSNREYGYTSSVCLYYRIDSK
jgi:hypothetical protein